MKVISPKEVRDWTNGEGAHIAIDAVGAPSVIRQCAELVASAGRVVIVGLSMQEVSLPAALELATEHLDQVEKVMIEVWNGESA
jgi:threonine dehydrogenase-like Zn-dependent dehydrogenase